MFVDCEKITTDRGKTLWFYAHKHLTWKAFTQRIKIMSGPRKGKYGRPILREAQFDRIDWFNVYDTLGDIPKLFQLWAAKQVMGAAGTWKYLAFQTGESSQCPCCDIFVEDTLHLNHCEEEGRRTTFVAATDILASWLDDSGTDPDLADCIIRYIKCRRNTTMQDIMQHLSQCFHLFAQSQDIIGWDQFMMGMVATELVDLQTLYSMVSDSCLSATTWSRTLITKLLEITHGQWIYRNALVHHKTTGFLISQHKEAIQAEIDHQLALGMDDLLEEDQHLLEINHDDLDVTSGECQEHWILAIMAARAAYALSAAASTTH